MAGDPPLPWWRSSSSTSKIVRRGIKLGAVCGLLFATLAGLRTCVLNSLHPAEVETERVAEEASPDGHWLAFVDETIYPLGATAVIDAVVRIKSQDDGVESDDLVIVDTGGHDEDRPRVRWISATELEVTVSNISSMFFKRASVGPVWITLRFDPGDPVAHAAWLGKTHELARNSATP